LADLNIGSGDSLYDEVIINAVGCVYRLAPNYTLSNKDRDALKISGGGWRNGEGEQTYTGSGKYYFEFEILYDTGERYHAIGISELNNELFIGPGWHTDATSYGAYTHNGYKAFDAVTTAGGLPITTGGNAGDILGCALDLDNGKIWFGIDTGAGMVWQGDPAAGTGEAYSGIDTGKDWAAVSSAWYDDIIVRSTLCAGDLNNSPPSGFSAWCSGSAAEPSYVSLSLADVEVYSDTTPTDVLDAVEVAIVPSVYDEAGTEEDLSVFEGEYIIVVASDVPTAEETSFTGDSFLDVSDDAGVTDVPDILFIYFVTVSDNAPTTDVVSGTVINIPVIVSSDILVTELNTFEGESFIDVSSDVPTGESVSGFPVVLTSVSDSVLVTDGPSILLISFVSVYDEVPSNDLYTVLTVPVNAVSSDEVSALELVVTSGEMLLSINDSTTVVAVCIPLVATAVFVYDWSNPREGDITLSGTLFAALYDNAASIDSAAPVGVGFPASAQDAISVTEEKTTDIPIPVISQDPIWVADITGMGEFHFHIGRMHAVFQALAPTVTFEHGLFQGTDKRRNLRILEPVSVTEYLRMFAGIRNGTFDADTDWITMFWGTITDGMAVFDVPGPAGGVLYQINIGVLLGQTYQTIYEVDTLSGSTTVTISLGGAYGTPRSSPGKYTENIVCSTGGNITFTATTSTGGVVKLDNVSVIPV